MQMKYKSGGFTLLELLIVIGLITLLMALLLPAIIKAKNSGQKQRTASNAKAIVAAIDGYKLRYHKWPAKNSDLETGRDVTYGSDGKDNKIVFDKLVNPPDGNPNQGEALIDLSDFIVDKSGNVLKAPLPDGKQYKITLDINSDYSPSGGIKVE
jgi:prepilin-type N-terminal cleavage/methylation domain-containing protein